MNVESNIRVKANTKKIKKDVKRKRKGLHPANKQNKIGESQNEAADRENVDHFLPVDGECSRPMKKKVKKDGKKRRKDLDAVKVGKLEVGRSEVDDENAYQILPADEDFSRGMKSGEVSGGGHTKKSNQSKLLNESCNSAMTMESYIGAKEKNKKIKKDGKNKKKHLHPAKENRIEESRNDADQETIDHFLPVDEDRSRQMKKKVKKDGKKRRKNLDAVEVGKLEVSRSEADAENVYETHDYSRGMKKWLIEYKESRPGLKILQQRIDDFMTAHEEQMEQERKEREALAEEEGWTVVSHHKGRKKTTDTESGTTVGSVAQAAIMDKMSKKKSTEVALNFYRFQRREARRNEVMMLQSKFEEDKKRIQQLRAARKFRPY